MKTQIATATKIMRAPAEQIYEILADYRTKHPLILPKPYFLSLNVEEGGIGTGTIVNIKMRILGQTRSFRSQITEPQPGGVLLETDLASGIATKFTVFPLENEGRTQVTISTELRTRNLVEGFLAKVMLQKVYAQELEQLVQIAEQDLPSAQFAQANNHSGLSK